jgi:hypothetical protein
MGWGDFGSNGSVHWRIGYEGNNPASEANQADQDNQVRHPGSAADGRPAIGRAGGKEHAGFFRVTARFASPGDADEALKNARVVGRTIRLDVPVRSFDSVGSDPGNPNNWEVRVDW